MNDCFLSPSSRGRGLKCVAIAPDLLLTWSPSSRGRGLKSIACCVAMFWQNVALFTRAWIEIPAVAKR
ncbi:hypothetical protein EUBSIR_01888 [[Eubacterium] siraeum DSM 15702]|uniref:Uncharacterized protein n=1 Tax=[Eubacterium] siraeum DSM 15702 TaxID=428128 RepID=B0MPT5_9FIRM|nr:hypothetical protein EUBSIR_01888 [[Eubacterium] siraeum DSM 15702]